MFIKNTSLPVESYFFNQSSTNRRAWKLKVTYHFSSNNTCIHLTLKYTIHNIVVTNKSLYEIVKYWQVRLYWNRNIDQMNLRFSPTNKHVVRSDQLFVYVIISGGDCLFFGLYYNLFDVSLLFLAMISGEDYLIIVLRHIREFFTRVEKPLAVGEVPQFLPYVWRSRSWWGEWFITTMPTRHGTSVSKVTTGRLVTFTSIAGQLMKMITVTSKYFTKENGSLRDFPQLGFFPLQNYEYHIKTNHRKLSVKCCIRTLCVKIYTVTKFGYLIFDL